MSNKQYFQTLNLKPYQLEWLTNHLGHTEAIHKLNYRATSGLIERSYMVKMMMIQDLNLVGKFKGRSIEDIAVEGKRNLLLDQMQ